MRQVRIGMVGGGVGAFIGGVHRMAMRLDGGFDLCAGALSGDPDRAMESAESIGLARGYPTWRAMLEAESALPEGERIEAVSIVTPNHAHYEPALAFAKAGVHVICDKPLCMNSEEAAALREAADAAGVVFCVTYNYSGYPMVKEARAIVAGGRLGTVRKVVVEYSQGWLNAAIDAEGHKQASWRTDPGKAGAGGAIGDIGSHAEQLVGYVTGLRFERICADLHTHVKGRRLDDDANLLVRLTNGATGLLFASQVSSGAENDLRLRVFGTEGRLEWRQEQPNELLFQPEGEPERVHRRGNAYLSEAAQAASRLPAGHPEAFIEAFANVYRGARAGILQHAGEDAESSLDFPTVHDGERGVRFIEAAVRSAKNDEKWTELG